MPLIDGTGTRESIPHDFILRATDGYPLAARLWVLPMGQSSLGTALVNAGAGIGMRYYDRFAQYLATHRVATLLYDYRGIGQSRPSALRGFVASVEDWGSKDCAAALEWLSAQFPQAPCTVIGHSVGGFVTGFVTNGRRIDRMMMVGAHTGYWRDYAANPRLAMYVLWHVLMPAATRVFGYFPGRRLRLLDDLPSGVALEWANRRRPEFWWNKLTSEGALDIAWRDEMLSRFRSIRAETLAIRLTDDAFATHEATSRLLELFRNCPATQMVFGPADTHGQKIGHFGFFRSRFRETLWPRVLAWLLNEKSPSA